MFLISTQWFLDHMPEDAELSAYMAENIRKIEIANNVFWFVVLLRIVFLIAVFIIVIKLAIRLCTGGKKAKTRKADSVYIQKPIQDSETYESQNGQWSPTGWYLDKETGKWEPPNYIKSEAKTKWKWDEKKKIWIDLDKKQRLERYHEFRKREGKEPTFEEWKAEKLRQEQQKNEHPEE